MLISLRLKGLKNKDINATCLAPVPHFPRPSQSMYFRDVSETNGREKKKTCSDHVTRNASTARNNAP